MEAGTTRLPINKLVSNPNNPRIIKDDKFRKLVQSLKEFPEMADVREVVVNKDLVILGGNMRYRAMKEAGWAEVPVKIVDWPEDKQREFVIKDNVSGGEWDHDMLVAQYELVDLDAWGLDLPVYDEPEISLPDEDRLEQQMTFTLSADQVNTVETAVKKAKSEISGDEINQNTNGNALYYMARKYNDLG